jgi:hypothetical protein
MWLRHSEQQRAGAGRADGVLSSEELLLVGEMHSEQ